MTDLESLSHLLADERLTDAEHEAFESMHGYILAHGPKLTPKQSAWIRAVASRLELDAGELTGPAFASGAIPVGKPVAVPAVLRVLPLKPPGRKST